MNKMEIVLNFYTPVKNTNHQNLSNNVQKKSNIIFYANFTATISEGISSILSSGKTGLIPFSYNHYVSDNPTGDSGAGFVLALNSTYYVTIIFPYRNIEATCFIKVANNEWRKL